MSEKIIKIKQNQNTEDVDYRNLEKGDLIVHNLLMSEIPWEGDLK